LSLAGSEARRIILSGGGANLKGLDQFLSKELNLPVVLGNPWVNILADPNTRVPEGYLRRSLSYATVLGLALRGVLSDSDFS
jgi:Tfp pilus assembly PilM family ATPase